MSRDFREQLVSSGETWEQFLARQPKGDPKPEDRYIWEGQHVEIVKRFNSCPECGARSVGGAVCGHCAGRWG